MTNITFGMRLHESCISTCTFHPLWDVSFTKSILTCTILENILLQKLSCIKFNVVNLEPMNGVQNYQIILIELTDNLDRPNQLEV